MVERIESREEWLKARLNGIGGSDAGAVIGLNKYRSNVDLWNEKTGRATAEDISDKPAVLFGKTAEPLIRELFRLDHSDYEVDYHEFWIYRNDSRPHIFATLDGELTDRNGRRGILEIKTCTIQNPGQWDEWKNQIPQSYYVQILHQLAATGWEFAVLRAYIRYYRDGDLRVSIREYNFDRLEVEEDIRFLIDWEDEFWECVKNDKCPALILPSIERI